MTCFLSIGRTTFLQTIRQPIFFVLILASFAVLVLSVALTGWTMGGDYHKTDQRMLEAMGLATLLVFGLLISAFSASAALAREIEDRTAMTVISKPVSRATFVLGKFGGVAAAVAVAQYLCGLVFLMTVRHKVMSAAWNPFDFPVIVLGCSALGLTILTAVLGNLFFGWPVVSAGVYAGLIFLTTAVGLIGFIGKGWTLVPFGTDISPQLLTGMVLILLAVMILTAAAIAASTRLGQVMTLLVCTGVFFVGSAHPALFKDLSETVLAVRAIGWLAPNLTYFYALDALATGKTIPADYVWAAAAYGALYVGAVLALGIAMFQRRSLETATGESGSPGPVSFVAWTGRGSAAVAVIVGLCLLTRMDLQGKGGQAFLPPQTQPGQPSTRIAQERPERPADSQYVLAVGTSEFWTEWQFVWPVVLLGYGTLAWLVFGFFGRGVGWSYWVVLGMGAIWFLRDVAAVVWPTQARFLSMDQGRQSLLLQTAAAAGILLVLALPRTRRHFRAQ